jgi:hypothetical protein
MPRMRDEIVRLNNENDALRSQLGHEKRKAEAFRVERARALVTLENASASPVFLVYREVVFDNDRSLSIETIPLAITSHRARADALALSLQAQADAYDVAWGARQRALGRARVEETTAALQKARIALDPTYDGDRVDGTRWLVKELPFVTD